MVSRPADTRRREKRQRNQPGVSHQRFVSPACARRTSLPRISSAAMIGTTIRSEFTFDASARPAASGSQQDVAPLSEAQITRAVGKTPAGKKDHRNIDRTKASTLGVKGGKRQQQGRQTRLPASPEQAGSPVGPRGCKPTPAGQSTSAPPDSCASRCIRHPDRRA